MIANIEVLTKAECQVVRDTVQSMGASWVRRSDLPFFTLGAASYMDAPINKAGYYQNAAIYNPLLWDAFGWVYERLTSCLEDYLGAPVTLHSSQALPGFHIFLADRGFHQIKASIHRDLQYALLDWEHPDETDFQHPISFTLAIAVPHFGAGLYLWDLCHEEMLELSQSGIEQLIGSRSSHYHTYELGKLAIHSGHQVHQMGPAIAPEQTIRPEDERITLQGHGLLCQGTWQLYW